MLANSVRTAYLSKVILRLTNRFTQEDHLTPVTSLKGYFLKQVILRNIIEFTQERLYMLEESFSKEDNLKTHKFKQEILPMLATRVKRVFPKNINLRFSNEFTQERFYMITTSVRKAFLKQLI